MKLSALLPALSLALAGSSLAGTVSVNFVGGAGMAGTLAPTDLAGDPMQSAFAGNWNNASGGNGTLNNLTLDDGSTSPFSISWDAPETYLVPNTAGGTNASGGANPAMMKGYIGAIGTSATDDVTLTISGLVAAGGTYSVIVYFDGDNGGDYRGSTYTLSGATTGNGSVTGEDSEGTDFNSGGGQNANGLFQLPVVGGSGNASYPTSPNNSEGNYALFTGVSGDTFTITGLPAYQSNGPRAPINGIQIIGVPEPASAVMLLGGAVLLGLRRRRAAAIRC